MIKTIVEQVNQDLSQYDDTDFTDVFIFLFRNWVSNKLGEEIKKYPFSFLLKKFGQEFLKETFGDKYNRYFGDAINVGLTKFTISEIGKKLVEIGAHTLPSLRQEKKFTEQYKKHIARLIKLLELPSFARLELTEDVPYEIYATLYIDYPPFLKSEGPSIVLPYHNPIEKKLKTIFEDYLGIEFGSPAHGKIKLSFTTILENEDEWVKKVLNKEIKKHIKAMPGGHNVHSIRFEPKTDKGYMRIIYKENSHRHMHQYEFRNNVREYLKGLGYTKIDVENV